MGDVRFGDRLGDHGLLDEPAKDQATVAGVAPVEPEGELLQIGLQVDGVDRAVMGAEDPALEQ